MNQRTKRLGFLALTLLSFGSAKLCAEVITFIPPVADMYDLDHNSAYTWRINSPSLVGKTILSAQLFIDNIRDWTIESNDVLYIRLLNDAKYSGIHTYTDNEASGDYNAKFGGISLVTYNDLLPYTAAQLASHATVDLTYNFTASQIATLMTYSGDGRFAMAFDPDCHYFNDGIKLTITTGLPPPPTIPEPGSLLLLGLGLLAITSIHSARFTGRRA